MTLEEILQVIDPTSLIFFYNGEFTDEGASAYKTLETILRSVQTLTNVDMNLSKVMENLDEIANERPD